MRTETEISKSRKANVYFLGEKREKKREKQSP
jgi:hypothetical protein